MYTPAPDSHSYLRSARQQSQFVRSATTVAIWRIGFTSTNLPRGSPALLPDLGTTSNTERALSGSGSVPSGV